MTLEEGKRKVYMLLDEYSSGGAITPDADIEAKMADFFDTAQKLVTAIKPIRRVAEIVRTEGQTEYALPADCRKLVCIRRGGKRTRRYAWHGTKLVIPAGETETVEAEYFAWPETLGPDTPDSYVFEAAEDAAQACCFYVASQQLISDLVLDYTALRNEWLSALQLLTPENPEGCYGMRQALFGGGA